MLRESIIMIWAILIMFWIMPGAVIVAVLGSQGHFEDGKKIIKILASIFMILIGTGCVIFLSFKFGFKSAITKIFLLEEETLREKSLRLEKQNLQSEIDNVRTNLWHSGRDIEHQKKLIEMQTHTLEMYKEMEIERIKNDPFETMKREIGLET